MYNNWGIHGHQFDNISQRGLVRTHGGNYEVTIRSLGKDRSLIDSNLFE